MPQVYLEKLKANAKQNLPVRTENLVADQEQEIWKPTKGYKEYYSISTSGKIKRTKAAQGTIPGKELKPYKNTRGYLEVRLSKNNKIKIFRIHRLVATTFLGNPPKGLEVNHIDGIKTNNNVSNLEYVTQSENIRHGYRLGLYKRIIGEKSHSAKLKEKDVLKIRKLFSANIYTNLELSKIYDVCNETIWGITTRKTWTHI